MSRNYLVTVFTLLLCASLYGADVKEVSFTTRDLDEGKATLTVTGLNASNAWTATVLPVARTGQTLPTMRVEPAQKGSAPSTSSDAVLHFYLANQPPPGTEVRYFLIVERTQGTPAKTSRDLTLLTVRPVLQLVPQAAGAKYVLTASRCVPFFTDWTIETPLMLQKPAEAAVLKSAAHVPVGVVAQSAGGSGMDVSALVKWGADPGKESDHIPLEMELSRWSSGKMTGTLTLPDGQTRDVVVQTSDHIFYPLAVIIIGVFIASRVKRYLTRGRPAAVLKATLEDTENRLLNAIETFRRTAENQPFATFGILGAWKRFRDQAESDLRRIQLQGAALDQNNADFTALSARINSQRQLPDAWIQFSQNLRILERSRSTVHALQPPAGLTTRPAIENEISNVECGFELTSVDDLTNLAVGLASHNLTAGSWLAAWQQSVRLITDGGKVLDVLARAQQAQRLLWEGFDTTTLNQANQTLREAADILSKSAPQAQRETVAQASLLPAPLPPARIPEVERIERRDTAAFLLALTLAVIVGLNAEYFGKAFGSVDDYARILAWALSTSIGVDLTTLALDRVGSVLGSGARVVTRA